MALRKYSCLTVGKAICLNYNNKKYYIDIVEARPQNAITVSSWSPSIPAMHSCITR